MNSKTLVSSHCYTPTDFRHSFKSKYAGFLLAAMPILAPYRLIGISVNWILGLVLIVLSLADFSDNKIRVKKRNSVFVIYTVSAFVLSLNGLFILNDTAALINSLLALILDLIIYIIAWENTDFSLFIKYGRLLGVVCCLYAAYQMIMQISGHYVPLGKLPFLDIGTGWVSEIWSFRFNSLFSEPSYFAIYLLPLFAYHLINSKWGYTLLFLSFIIVSSSSLGIVISLAVIFWYTIVEEGIIKKRYRRVATVLFLCGLVLLAFLTVPFLNRFFSLTLNKLFDINSGVSDSRLLGYIEYFNYLEVKEQFLGVGIAQLKNYFAERGISIANYSNSLVLTLLNFGIIGLVFLVGFLFSSVKEAVRRKSVVFLLICFLVFMVDSILFSGRFYYLIYFVWYYPISSEEDKL